MVGISGEVESREEMNREDWISLIGFLLIAAMVIFVCVQYERKVEHDEAKIRAECQK